MDVVAVLLAAGGGRRFRAGLDPTTDHAPGHKLLADLQGRPVYRHALDHVLGAGFPVTLVVTGAVPVPLTGDDRHRGARPVHNPAWSDGQATSLAVAVEAARSMEADAIVVGLADQPFVPSSAWQSVADAPLDAPLVVAVYADDGAEGAHRLGPNPVRIHRSLWDDLPTEGDEGARGLIRRHRSTVHEVSCPGSPADIDTLEDLERWTSS